MNNKLIPVKGAWVRDVNSDKTGTVQNHDRNEFGTRVLVHWHRGQGSSWMPLEKISCGFKKGMDVVDVPFSRVRASLGDGVTIDLRRIGGRDQVLVDFLESGEKKWLPYENLRHVRGVRHRFLTADTGKREDVERFRLRSLAYALELWNENTGSLSHIDIDPLPHQIHLVHHILASGNLNWLIADDVGLGKTIEVGMLFSALKQRKKLRRVLLVTPAGLTKQWQDELHHKFGMSDFEIYGEDFHITEAHRWKLHDFVIGSIDRLKDEQHLDSLLQAEPWDLVVFDEAHRLSRRQYGMKLDASQRFRLAAELRKCTDNILLLSATPHQGLTDKFQALLEILRPEWKKEIRRLEQSPDFLKHMVIRNNKSDVTDVDGNFIFKGKSTKAIRVDVGKEAAVFDKALQSYLRLGYAAGASRGLKGQAIGFVMTTYRKLAASSAAAIFTSLVRRLNRLHDESETKDSFPNYQEQDGFDARFEGESLEQAGLFDPVFFDGEIPLLEELIEKAQALLENDKKLQSFLVEIIPSILSTNPEEKILIFSEYRSTQDHIALALRRKYGEESVELINGSMRYQDRMAAIERFEDKALFLISTEAGGEGINLQKKCHVMINFDLPWNPMRLVQRIGRLYRYGQKQKVVVFNIHAPNTMDEEIMGLMYERISAVVKDMAQVGEEYREGLEDDILGEIAELVDVKSILNEATSSGLIRTKEKIDEALTRAQEATSKQRELFEFAASFDPSETKNELNIGPEHVGAFIRGMFKILKIEILAETHHGTVLQIRLPDELLEKVKGFKQRMTVTFDRAMAAARSNIQMLDLNSPLMRFFVSEAKIHGFGGQSTSSTGIEGRTLMTGVLRWQDDQGKRMRQEYTALLLDANGSVQTNPPSFGVWLKKPALPSAAQVERAEARLAFNAFELAADSRLSKVSNRDLHPENKQWVSSMWVEQIEPLKS